MRYYPDPTLVAPLPGNLTKVAYSVVDEIARQKAARDVAVEQGRQRELETMKAQLFPVVREVDPVADSEANAAFWAGIRDMEYTHQFPMNPRRAARREERDLPGYRESRPVSTFTPQDIADLRGAQSQGMESRIAAQKAEADARMGFELPREYMDEEQEPTRVTPQGVSYYETDVSRAEADRARAAGGSRSGGYGTGARKPKDITSGLKRVNDLYVSEYGQGGQPVYKSVLNAGGAPIDANVQGVYNSYANKMLNSGSTAEIDAALSQAEQQLGNMTVEREGAFAQGVGSARTQQGLESGAANPDDANSAIGQLRGMRARLYEIYGENQSAAEKPEGSKEEGWWTFEKEKEEG